MRQTGQIGPTQSGSSSALSTIGTRRTICESIEDLHDLDKLGQGFTLADPLEKVDIGDGFIPRPTFGNANLLVEYKADLIQLC